MKYVVQQNCIAFRVYSKVVEAESMEEAKEKAAADDQGWDEETLDEEVDGYTITQY